MASCWPLPFGRSGCVNTATTSCPAPTMRSRLGTANAGVPMKISLIDWPLASGPWPLFLSPLARFLQFANLAPDQVAFQRADVADIQPPVQVIGLVQKRARQQVLAGHFEFGALGVARLHRDLPGPRHLFAEFGQAEAALFAFLRPLAVHDPRIDQHDLLPLLFADSRVDYRYPLSDADLRRRQPHSVGGVHGLEHILHQLVQLGRIEFPDLFRFFFQYRLPVLHYRIDHQKFFTCSRYPSKLRLVSPSESPPNFSIMAAASTSETIASPITPAAGTTATSLRS